MKRTWSPLFTLFFVVIVLVISCKSTRDNQEGAPKGGTRISIACTPYSFTGYTVFVAKEKGFFRNAGLEVVLHTSFPDGRATLEALEHGADFAVCSETPFIRAISAGAEISIVTETITAENHLAIIARTDKGIRVVEDLKGKSIGVTKGSKGEYFLDLVLMLHNVPGDSITAINVKPSEMMSALKNGTVDAVTTWSPIKNEMINKFGDRVVTFTAEGLYSPYFLVAAKKTFIAAHPASVRKLVEALHNTSLFIHQSPIAARQIASTFLETTPLLLEESSDSYIFQTFLDQSLLITLEDQLQWLIKNDASINDKHIDFSDYIYFDALQQVAPGNITIIR